MTIRVLAFLALLLLTAPAQADTIYTYTGDYFAERGGPVPSHLQGVYTTADRITGSFTVADGFLPALGQAGRPFTDGVLAYSFSDGHQTLTKANSTGMFFLTLAAPDVEPLWFITITSAPSTGISLYYNRERSDFGILDAENFGGNSGCVYGVCDGSHLGTWTVSVPEPMSLLLAVAGLGGVVLLRRFPLEHD